MSQRTLAITIDIDRGELVLETTMIVLRRLTMKVQPPQALGMQHAKCEELSVYRDIYCDFLKYKFLIENQFGKI